MDKWNVSKYFINCKDNSSNKYMGKLCKSISWKLVVAESGRVQRVPENGAVVGRDGIFLAKAPSALVMPANPFLPPMCPGLAAWGEPLSVIPANSTWKERRQLFMDLQPNRCLAPVLMTSPAADSFKRLAGTLLAVDENGNKIGGSFTHEV